SRGIGYAIAKKLVEEGVDVAINARGEDALRAAALRLGEEGRGRVLAVPADVGSTAGVEGLVDRGGGPFGRLHLLVNVAGPSLTGGDVLDLPDQSWTEPLLVKFLGAVRVSRAALPKMPTDGTGRVINVTGAAAKTYIPRSAATAVTNAALITFTKYL